MKINPLLDHPDVVLISRTPVSEPPRHDHFACAACQILTAMQIEVEGEPVVIKPNATIAERFADPDSGVTTHPACVQELIDHLCRHGGAVGRMHIIEDPRNSDDDEPRHWHGTGYDVLAEKTGVSLSSPTAETSVSLQPPRPLALPALRVSRLAADPNTTLINVPKLKTHNLGITTLCLKNLMGLVYVLDRHFCGQAWRELGPQVWQNPRPRHEWLDRPTHERWQEGLARRLADTAQILHPRLNLVEGVVGREGTGFQRGCNRLLGLMIAGINMVAVDSVASYLMGFDPQQLVYLRVAVEAGLGVADGVRLNDLNRLRVYTVQDGAPTLCSDLEAWRVRPPFRVISDIVDQEPCPF